MSHFEWMHLRRLKLELAMYMDVRLLVYECPPLSELESQEVEVQEAGSGDRE
jgi:hypothetical protein